MKEKYIMPDMEIIKLAEKSIITESIEQDENEMEIMPV